MDTAPALDVEKVQSTLAKQNLTAPPAVLKRLEARYRALQELRDVAYTDEAKLARTAAIDAECRNDIAAIEAQLLSEDPELVDLQRQERTVIDEAAGNVALMPARLELARVLTNPGELLRLYEEVLLSQHVGWATTLGVVVDQRYRALKQHESVEARRFRALQREFHKTHPTALDRLNAIGEQREARTRHIRSQVRWTSAHGGLPEPRTF